MAQFLIMGIDRTHPDPEKSARLWKIGMVVDIFEDNKGIGQHLDGTDTFYLIKINGITKKQADKYLGQNIDFTNPLKPVYAGKRLYKLRISDLPQTVVNQLKTTRYYETSLSSIKIYIQNIRTGVNE